MIPRDPAKPLIYIHIPKTAGTAMQALVRRNYSEEEIHLLGKRKLEADGRRSFRRGWEGEVHRLERSGFEPGRAPRIVFGHMSFGLHRAFPDGAQYVSMVRHPVARVVSHYRFVKRSPGHHLHRFVMEKNLRLEDYVEGTAAQVLNNGQVRCLFGDAHRGVGFDRCSEDMLDRALDNIDTHFVFIGVQERFDDSVSLLCRSVGWREVEVDPRNVSMVDDEDVSPDAVAGILEYNALDMALYERLLGRLESMLASMPAEPE